MEPPDAMSDTTKTDATSDKTTEETFPEGVGDAGKAAIQREREARKEADRKATEASKELSQLRKEKADRDAEKVKADEEKAKKDGDLQTLVDMRAKEAADAKADAETKGSKLMRAETAVATIVADRIKELDALKDAELSAEFAAITDPIDQLEWFGKASTKRALANAGEAAKVANAQGQPRTPMTPRSNSGTPQDAAIAAKRDLQRDPLYGI